MRIFERRRQQPGDGRDALVKRQILGDVAGLVTVDKGQAGLILDRQQLDVQPLQVGLCANVLGQHQLDESVLLQTGCQQVDKLRVMIRREAGGNGHVETSRRGNRGMTGILRGIGGFGTGLFFRQVPATPPGPEYAR
ncbi:hypothetical protein D3C86_1752730 [compost metagenome]